MSMGEVSGAGLGHLPGLGISGACGAEIRVTLASCRVAGSCSAGLRWPSSGLGRGEICMLGFCALGLPTYRGSLGSGLHEAFRLGAGRVHGVVCRPSSLKACGASRDAGLRHRGLWKRPFLVTGRA